MIVRLPSIHGNRCRCVIHGGLVYAVAVSPDKTPSFYEQARQTFRAIDATLAEAGSGKSKILTVTVFIADMARKEEMNRAWDEWVDMQNIPLRACLGTELTGQDLIEVLVTAAQ
jgi:enamine deaminase RidA (YjgF/YER057c/UK114 family)